MNLENVLEYKKTIADALKALGKKNFALIAHANSFPSSKGEDTGFGTINSKASKELMKFVSGIFNAIQLGPSGKTKAIDSSPYTGTIFSDNPLFIDLYKLTTTGWHNILSEETFFEITQNNPNKDKSKTAYSYIFEEQTRALKEAFSNFKKLDSKELGKRFNKFKQDNKFWLEKDSLYEVLSIEHDNDYWPLWENKVDKNLFNTKNDTEKTQSQTRINELRKKYADELEFYAFCQFVIFEQNEKTKEFALTHDIKMIADRQVAFSDRDIWAYQSLFLDGWYLGCPPDYFSKDGQAWGFPVTDPEKLFNKDGSLGDAGILLKQLYSKMFTQNPGGVRIDHIVGLIDPWVYKKGLTPKAEHGAGRLFSSPEHPELSKYAIATLEDLNLDLESDKEYRVKKLSAGQIKQYGALIEKIIIASAKEAGLDKDAIVCEDLGTLTYPVESVLKHFDLQGMKLTQFVAPDMSEHPYRGKNITKRSWAMVGTHDNKPLIKWARETVNTDDASLHAENLTEDLFKELDEPAKNNIKHKLRTDAEFLEFVKFVEIFASKSENIQIFFTDFFGIDETYNTPGTSGDKNWSLRIPNDFETFYAEQLENNRGLNLAKVLKTAIEARGKEFSEKNSYLVYKLEEFIL